MSLPVYPVLPGLGFPVKRGQVFDNNRQRSLSGKRTVFPNMSYPTYAWEHTFNVLRGDPTNLEWQTLEGFIASTLSGYGLFAFSDPNDSTVTNQGFGVGDGVSTAFQLVRAFGGFTSPIFLVNGTPTITVGGTPTTPASISPYGVVTFSSPPAALAALEWTGSFYFPCRFDEDVASFSNFMMDGSGEYPLVELKTLKFSSEKLP